MIQKRMFCSAKLQRRVLMDTPLVCLNGDEMAMHMWEEVKNHVSLYALTFIADSSLC
jgi:hypothetical protein